MPAYDKKDPAFFTQQPMLIGTYDPDGKERFCTISWVSYTWGPPPCLVVSIWGVKKTKDNIARTGMFSAAVVTPELLPLCEQFNRGTYKKELYDSLSYEKQNGTALDVPIIAASPYSFECRVKTVTKIGETMTYFGEIEHVVMSEEIQAMGYFDLCRINPVVYASEHYFTVGKHIGKIGDYS